MTRTPQGEWRHTQNWNNWGYGRGWNRGYGYFGYGFGYSPFLFPGWWGWYGGPNYYGYWPSYYGGYYDDETYTLPATYTTPLAASQETPAVLEEAGSTDEQGEQYAVQAREAFRDGDYRNALRLAGHAAVEMPRDAAIHELMSLALFAMKDYRAAAIEAHAALALGPPIDWPTLYNYYGNGETYTKQLRALEKFAGENPKKPEGLFLLGYQYIMIGSKDAAEREFSKVLTITPADTLVEKVMKELNHK